MGRWKGEDIGAGGSDASVALQNQNRKGEGKGGGKGVAESNGDRLIPALLSYGSVGLQALVAGDG